MRIPIFIALGFLFSGFLGCKQKETPVVSQSQSSPTELFARYNLDKIKLPPGFSINVFAEVPDARSMCFGEKG